MKAHQHPYRGPRPITQGDKKNKEDLEMRKLAAETLKRDYAEVFTGKATPEVAQRVFFDMMNYCMVNSMTMTGNTWTYFNEGRRDIGRRIKALVPAELRAAYEQQMEVIVE